MFRFENLDDINRRYMLIEIDHAIQANQLHLSQRFTEHCHKLYPCLLREAIQTGNETSLATALQEQDLFEKQKLCGTVTQRVLANAVRTFDEGQFNAFYMRGVCHRAIQTGSQVMINRAKEVDKMWHSSPCN